MPTWLFLLALGLFGLAFGSFGNVVIWRLPRGESLSHPASHCPKCEMAIRWYDNIPVASWLLLRGKCRGCGEPISVRYPLVELLSGALWVLAGAVWGMTLTTAFAVTFFYVLLLLAFIDLDTFRLPNSLVGLLAGIGLAGAAVSQFTQIPAAPIIAAGGWLGSNPLMLAILGAVVSAGSSGAIAGAYWLWRRNQGFGMGDVKLLGAMGVFLGAYGLLALFVGSMMGAVYGVVAMSAEKLSLRTRFPFGPFLALAGIIVAIAGKPLVGWYLGLLS